mmetsp:Transcript_136955/g.381801  ORF Transcript_136955/g.381801 Transcript_136955/m.381801 type:complete len:243 (-) Transcript_136955:65-793(-)
MGNTLITTHRIACGHTDRGQLRQSLLCDRLSQPTAEMVEALIVLQGQPARLKHFAERGATGTPPTLGDLGSRPVLLLAMAFCILFGYRYQSGGTEGITGSSASQGRANDEPVQPNDFIAAFEGALRCPQEFLQDLLSLRAQVVPRERLQRLIPLVSDSEGVHPNMFSGPYGEILRNLAIFIRAAVESAQIYGEIRDSAAAGKIDAAQAARLLDGVESDQRRMLDAMGGGGNPDDDELEDGYQ